MKYTYFLTHTKKDTTLLPDPRREVIFKEILFICSALEIFQRCIEYTLAIFPA